MNASETLKIVVWQMEQIEKHTGERFQIFRSFDYGETYYQLTIKGDAGMLVANTFVETNGNIRNSLVFYPKGSGMDTLYPARNGSDMFKLFDQVVVENIEKLSSGK